MPQNPFSSSPPPPPLVPTWPPVPASPPLAVAGWPPGPQITAEEVGSSFCEAITAAGWAGYQDGLAQPGLHLEVSFPLVVNPRLIFPIAGIGHLVEMAPSSENPYGGRVFTISQGAGSSVNLTGFQMDDIANKWLEYRNSITGAPKHGWQLAIDMRIALCEWYSLMEGNGPIEEYLDTIKVSYANGVISLRGNGIPATGSLKHQYPHGWSFHEDYNMDDGREKLAQWKGLIKELKEQRGQKDEEPPPCAEESNCPTPPVGLDDRVF